MGKKKKTVLIIIAFFVVLFGVLGGFYLSKLGLLQRGDNDAAGGAIDSSEDGVLDDELAMEEALAHLEWRNAVSADGEIYVDKDVLNILLIGTDERSDSFSTNARGDSCMILSLNKKTGDAKLVSLERGMGFPILEGAYEGQYDWLTHTFRYGGADLMMKEVRECLKVDVTHYVRVNFNTFKKGIAAIGGIDVTLSQAEADYINQKMVKYGGNTVTVGENHLDGYQAITYARCRKIDSDWHRIERQRTVVQAAINQTKNLSISEMNALLNDVLPLVQTNLTNGEITGLLLIAPKFRGVTFEQMTIPAEGTYGGMTGMDGRSLFAVDFNENSKILREFLYGVR